MDHLQQRVGRALAPSTCERRPWVLQLQKAEGLRQQGAAEGTASAPRAPNSAQATHIIQAQTTVVAQSVCVSLRGQRCRADGSAPWQGRRSTAGPRARPPVSPLRPAAPQGDKNPPLPQRSLPVAPRLAREVDHRESRDLREQEDEGAQPEPHGSPGRRAGLIRGWERSAARVCDRAKGGGAERGAGLSSEPPLQTMCVSEASGGVGEPVLGSLRGVAGGASQWWLPK